MPTTAKLFPTRRQTQAAFETLYPELLSRVTVLARHSSDPDEAAGEMLAFAWANFASVARRRGIFLPPSMLAWVSNVRYRSGRMLAGSTVTDVHSPAAQVRGRARVSYLSALSCSKRHQVLGDSAMQNITNALTASERERPDVRAATRIDWSAFMRTLSNRMRRIVRGLVVGDSKGLIAHRLGISNGRLSQLLSPPTRLDNRATLPVSLSGLLAPAPQGSSSTPLVVCVVSPISLQHTRHSERGENILPARAGTLESLWRGVLAQEVLYHSPIPDVRRLRLDHKAPNE